MFGSNLNEILYTISYGLVPLIFAVTIHETAHGWTAKQFGDPTADQLGRLTLNPIRHIDPFGTILLPLLLIISGSPFIFGAAKPVPVNARRLRDPQWNMAVVALAGPGVNLLMAFFWAVFAMLQFMVLANTDLGSQWLLDMADFGIRINVILAVFNMLPIPPLDGSRVIKPFLPIQIATVFDRVEPFGIFIVLGLIMLEAYGVIQFLSAFVLPPYLFLNDLFYSIIRIGGM